MKTLPVWLRIILLIVLGYEALGCLIGGASLVAEPDGSLMALPLEKLNGAFADFLIPGIILFALGILNTVAFVAVLKRRTSDWFYAGLALGGMSVWFVVEIVILQELVWLHIMWAMPVLLGWIFAVPLFAWRHDSPRTTRTLLLCGLLSSVWYALACMVIPQLDPAYNSIQYTISELSAINAPTRIAWVLTVLPYPLLFAAFGWGLLRVAQNNRSLRTTGILVIAYSVINLYWPPMHMRSVIGGGGGTLTDTLHLVWANMALAFMMLMMGFGAAALNKQFRIYTFATWIVFAIFGTLTFMEAPNIEANEPTQYIGLYERLNIGAFILWVTIFSRKTALLPLPPASA